MDRRRQALTNSFDGWEYLAPGRSFLLRFIVVESGLKPDDKVVVAGLLRAIPGQKVDPQLKNVESGNAAAK